MKKEREALEEIRCFISKIMWQKISRGGDERGKSGITWIEQFALYMCKGAGDQKKEAEKKDPLKSKQSLQKALAAFKVQCKRVKNFCIKEGEEHHLATSYCQANRLRKLGIDNRHAAIVGMPVLDEEDSITITQAILAMRGVNQKKHKEKQADGNLLLPIRTMAYKGAATAWMRSLKYKQDDAWIKMPIEMEMDTVTKEIIKSIRCPECGWMKNIEKYKVYGKVGFSRITCMQCHITSNASAWRCSCKLLWHKCEKHILRTLMNASDRVNGCFERGRHVVKRVSKVYFVPQGPFAFMNMKNMSRLQKRCRYKFQ